MRKFIFLLFLSAFSISFSQIYSTKSKKAIKKYEEAKNIIRYQRNFDEGILLYQQAIKADDEFVEAYLSLASAYELLNKMSAVYDDQIINCYEKIVQLNKKDEPYIKASFELGKIRFKQADYTKALSLFQEVEKAGGVSEKSFVYFLASSKFSSEAINKKIEFNPKKMSIETINRFPHNSRPTLTANGETMVYSVRSEIGRVDENIVWATKTDGDWEQSESISGMINTPANEGMPTISGDGKTLVFTSCDNRSDCDLYISHYNGGEWDKPQNLKQLNSGSWDSEASLSADGKAIVFSSNRKGGYGGFDLYFSKQNEDGKWSFPRNLGPEVNTFTNEVTPFLHASGNRIYFASLGHPGFGGYDLFYTDKLLNRWQGVTNLGTPINTVDNEGALFVTTDAKKGYFEQYTKEHNRAFSVIYEFDMPKELLPSNKSMYLTGIVTNAKTNAALKSSIIVLDLESRDTIGRVESSADKGNYTVVLTEGHEYMLWAKSDGYLFYSENFEMKNTEVNNHELNISLIPIEGKGEKIEMKNIFFNSGSFELLSKSFVELDLLTGYLKEKKIVVEIQGHTDNVGGAAANLLLSENRAKSVKEYLIKKGVAVSQLKSKGLGETQPISTNDSVQGKAKNRRIEFKIISIN